MEQPVGYADLSRQCQAQHSLRSDHRQQLRRQGGRQSQMTGTGVSQSAGNAETVMGGAAMPPLVVEHVTKSYEVGGRIVPVIGDLSLTLLEGEIVSIVGPSGCGKTTLLDRKSVV